MRQARLFAGVYVLAYAAVLTAILIVNLLGNASGLFPSPYFPASSERAWKTRRLDDAIRESRPPKIIIFGSSRVMQIQPKYVQAVTGKTAFNYGVFAASPTDYLTQFRYLLHIGCRPEIVLLGVDESAFRYENKGFEMQTLGHLGLFREMPFPENLNILVRCLRRIDLGTTQQSLSSLVRRKHSVTHSIEDDSIFLEDGYWLPRHRLRKMEDGTFDQTANTAADVGQKDLIAMMQQSLLHSNPRELDHFEEFLSLSRAEGIEVRVMFLPLHPDFERQGFTEQLSQARSSMSQKLQRTCTQYRAVYRDFTELASYDGDPSEFCDYGHQTPVNLRKMVNVLFGIRASDVMAHLPTDSELLKDLPPVTTVTKE